jgi:hypothetical protein
MVTDQLATEEPFLNPGIYTTNNLYFGSDGYKWKYVYTIDVGNKVRFMDGSWMPVTSGTLTPNPLQANPDNWFICRFW